MGPSPFSDGRKEGEFNEGEGTRLLQWGHRLSAMEGFQLRQTYQPYTTCFNGAIAFQRWKVGDMAKPCPHLNKLQWGHRLSAMEGKYLLDVGVVYGALQWGHRLSAMEGATEADQLEPLYAASMGPSPFSDGRPSTRQPNKEFASELQWGHRLSAMEGF